MFINSRMDKEDVIYTHTHTHTHMGILLSHKKEWNEIWMDQKIVIQSEVNQKEKNKYCNIV